MADSEVKTHYSCYHCGAKTRHAILYDDHEFCCNGCQMVYTLLRDQDLCQYYDLNAQPGKSQKEATADSAFSFLKVPSLLHGLLLFDSATEQRMRFYLPQVHCSSCLYLLEKLHKLLPGVKAAKLEFERKELLVSWDPSTVSAFDVACKLNELGYAPYFSLADKAAEQGMKTGHPANLRLMRMGVAGFAFGNIMLLSFPEYLSDSASLGRFAPYFQYLAFGLSLPVMFYSAQEFYQLAWAGLRKRFLNIDLPIVLALLVTFFRSLYEVFVQGGNGYWDSLTGIVFFMLVGRYLQDRTQYQLNYDRQFESHFPLAVSQWVAGVETPIAIGDLKPEMEIVLRDGDLLPVDARLVSEKAQLDYSFVSGESLPQSQSLGSWCYAGARMVGASARFKVEKELSQSYLVSLWQQAGNQRKDESNDSEDQQVQNWSQWFTLGVMLLAFLAGLYWFFIGSDRWLEVVSSVLIVACPCTLLLAVTFANGHALARLARAGLFLKNGKVLAELSKVNALVFDKTGTLTESQNPELTYHGRALSEEEWDVVAAVASESVHPYARAVARKLDRARVPVQQVCNVPGMGVEALSPIGWIRLGSSQFLTDIQVPKGSMGISIAGELVGAWTFQSRYRKGLGNLFAGLSQRYDLRLLSGDSSAEQVRLIELLHPVVMPMQFNQQPHEKVHSIQAMQTQGLSVVMVGDGLNDAAALSRANVGIAVTESQGQFTPASDAVLSADRLGQLDRMLGVVRDSRKVIRFAFLVSLLYNAIGLSIAISGHLEPVVAAILMPASSISMIIITALGMSISVKRHGLKRQSMTKVM
jgi:Cu+-exporting ATPase